MPSKIAVLPGDGIGPEVTEQAIRVLDTVKQLSSVADFVLESHDFGGIAIDKHGVPLPDSTLSACVDADAVLLGSVGGPKWDGSKVRPEQGLLGLRKALGLYANIRPASFPSPSLVAASPLKPEVARGVNFVVVRELIGGVYFGNRKEAGTGNDPETAWDTMIYSVEEIQRIVRVAAKIALTTNPPMDVHSIDKANVLATSRLWRRIVTETMNKEFPTVKFDHSLVDSAAMVMVSNPRKLNGVIVTENMFGDILSDEASVIPGSLGLLPSASLAGPPILADSSEFKRCQGLYEPIHGSAPDIAGRGVANPIGAILSAALMLRYSFGMEKEARAIEAAVSKALDSPTDGGMGIRTRDLGGTSGTKEVGDMVIEVLKTIL